MHAPELCRIAAVTLDAEHAHDPWAAVGEFCHPEGMRLARVKITNRRESSASIVIVMYFSNRAASLAGASSRLTRVHKAATRFVRIFCIGCTPAALTTAVVIP
jgi:hypothetical protein